MASAQIYPHGDHQHMPSFPVVGTDDMAVEQQLPTPTPQSKPAGDQSAGTKYRLLTHAEWVQFCRGFRDGLYRDVVFEKTKFIYLFHFVNTVTWLLMLTQLALSAILTALGSLPKKNGIAITTIAGVNTAVAGVLALIHNSGLPSRFRSDRNEFHKLEEHLKEIINAALVPADQSINEALAGCYEMFRAAQQTVENNMPASYASLGASAQQGAKTSRTISSTQASEQKK